jgi:flagellar biosynthesis/type III secretory pathway protein FliH
LPTELEKRLMDEVYTLERNVTMPYVTSAERFGIEKGLQQGLQQGRQEGRQEGRQKGRQEGEAALLQSLLARRFGALPDFVRIRLDGATVEQLESWAIKVLDARSLDEIFDQG